MWEGFNIIYFPPLFVMQFIFFMNKQVNFGRNYISLFAAPNCPYLGQINLISYFISFILFYTSYFSICGSKLSLSGPNKHNFPHLEAILPSCPLRSVQLHWTSPLKYIETSNLGEIFWNFARSGSIFSEHLTSDSTIR